MLHLVGSTVDGRFELLRLAGRGGMGAVYEAIERGLDRRCAVKLLISTDAPKAKRRFLREAKLTAKISHPGVVNVFAQGTDPKTGFPYIAMEYLDGESLDQTLEKGPLSWVRTKHIVLQVCRALEAAHEKGIVHRDLKPSNCMRTTIDGDEDVIKLVDFGIAKALVLDQTKLTNANTPIGTADYMAYEQAKGEKTDHRADVWSTGVLIYELVSGLLPFRGGPQNPVYRILSILEHEPISLAASVPTGAIPDGLSEIVARALCKDVNQRFQSIRELRLAIEPLATNQTIVRTKPYPSPGGRLGNVQQTKVAVDRPSPIGQTELDPAHIISVDSPSLKQVEHDRSSGPSKSGPPAVKQQVEHVDSSKAAAAGQQAENVASSVPKSLPIAAAARQQKHVAPSGVPKSQPVAAEKQPLTEPRANQGVVGAHPSPPNVAPAQPSGEDRAKQDPANSVSSDNSRGEQSEPAPADEEHQTNYVQLALLVGAVAVLTILIFVWSTKSTPSPPPETTTAHATTHEPTETTSAGASGTHTETDTTDDKESAEATTAEPTDSGSDATSTETTDAGSGATTSEPTNSRPGEKPSETTGADRKKKKPPKVSRSQACRKLLTHINDQLNTCYSGSKPPIENFTIYTNKQKVTKIDVDRIYKKSKFTACLGQITKDFDFKAAVNGRLTCELK